jgi:hypothetical protein
MRTRNKSGRRLVAQPPAEHDHHKVLRQRWDEACKPLQQLSDATNLLLRAVRLLAKKPRPSGEPSMDEKSDDLWLTRRDVDPLAMVSLRSTNRPLARHYGTA